jgi:hypothetical protein
MAVLAMRLCGVSGRERIPAPRVFSGRYRLEVIGVAARTISTKVVDHQSVWN